MKKCVCCGCEYTESNGYGYCLSCEDGIDGKNITTPIKKSRKSSIKENIRKSL